MNKIELLFTELLNVPRHQLYLKRPEFNFYQSQRLKQALVRLSQGEPLQYILGQSDFMGLCLKLNSNVFIPRPETELLVEAAIEQVLSFKNQDAGINILDLGTGSGCIAISLAKFLPHVSLVASDISGSALEISRINAVLNQVSERIKFIQSDMFNNQAFDGLCFEMIVSNPPYIPGPQIDQLEKQVRSEPRLALDGGSDGLDYYRRIAKESLPYLKKGSFLIMEIGLGQSAKIKNMFKINPKLEIIDIIKDYREIDRIVIAKRR